MNTESNQILPADQEQVVRCAGCKETIDYGGKGTPLCAECRTRQVRYPIPKGIQIFGGGILAIMLIAFFSLPESFSTGIHFKKGKKAAEARNYRTAQKEFEQVVKQNPEYLAGQVNLMMAAYYNMDLQTVSQVLNKIENRRVDDDELYNQASAVVYKTGDYFPSDSLNKMTAPFNQEIDSVAEIDLRAYSIRHPDEVYPYLALASRLINSGQFEAADSAVDKAAHIATDNMAALRLKIALKRELNQKDSAHYFIDRLLQINREDIYAISVQSRMLLNERKDKEALQLARKACALNEKDAYAAASLALAYHFNGMSRERDQLIQQSALDSTRTYYFTYVKDVLSGAETFTR